MTFSAIFMIVVDNDQIGGCGKGETINAADLGRRLVIEWTTQLPSTERHTVTR
jgi:hypothetical protein